MAQAAFKTTPARHYRDPERYERERRAVFGTSWLFLGHESQLARVGDVLAETMAGFPLLALRSETGLRAFHNVCRHRAGPLAQTGQSHCGAALTCKYHGWSYTLDGRLKAARDFGPASNLDVRDFSLLPLAIESWRGFLFVHAGTHPTPLSELTGPLDWRLGARDVSGLVYAGRKTHDIACNWKTYVENYLEGYHIPLVHPGLEAEIDSSRYEVTLEGDICFHRAPLRGEAADAVYDGVWAFAWPNLGLNIYGHGLMMERMLPVGAGATRLVYDYYLKPEIAADAGERNRILAMSAAVTAEDTWICERVAENIDAGIYTQGLLSPKHEAGLAWFQNRLGELVP